MSAIGIQLRRKIEAWIKPAGITFPQFGFLMILRERDGLSQRELADLAGCDVNTATVVLDGLEKRGLVERRADPEDRRVKRIGLTGQGASLMDACLPEALPRFQALIDAFPEERARELLPELERLLESVKSLEVS